MWDSFAHLEWDPTSQSGFLGKNEYNYTAPLALMKEGENEEEEEEEEKEEEDEAEEAISAK
jgi:hypothetical protein